LITRPHVLNVLNIQPVIPVPISANWTLITRIITQEKQKMMLEQKLKQMQPDQPQK